MSKWIRAREQLPDYNTCVLGAIKWPSGKVVLMTIYRMADEGDSWEWLTADDNSRLVYDVDVVYWCEIPALPDE